ncbi:MAG: AAA family ATPase [Planctomycetota bacterium]|nr:MAG: AAA family ATPase [Planctomycetota bacterium]
MRAEILFGPPGCGKTRRAEMAALPEHDPTGQGRRAALVFYQCHAWSDADELFVGVDVAAAVAGDAKSVRQDGVLTRAARLSHEGRVVLVLDELDKAPERVEALLLDYLQSGRAPVAPGRHVQADLDNMEVYITSNNLRPLGDALLRRCRRRWMTPLSAEQVERIAAERVPHAPRSVLMTLRKAAWAVAAAEGRDHVTVAELTPMLEEVLEASSIGDVRDALAGWAARTEQGAEYALRAREAAPVWAEVVAARRKGEM